jgi:hypothetical protein
VIERIRRADWCAKFAVSGGDMAGTAEIRPA